ncbi:MAG: hypothetical protein HKN45_04400 [Flavobacteriales bacterium]|nr:hypothetical protein [Flavobacteriales bacterium]
MSSAPEIFFHIGLGKTGTTFLQYRAFPLFKNLEYIQRTRFRNAKKIISNSSSNRFFLSYECDQQLERVATEWASAYPNTIPIIVFRRHDSWIASQFRRFVKNCHVKSFQELYDIEKGTGLFKNRDLEFYPMIEMLEEKFDNEAMVFLYDDLRRNPEQFIANWAERMGSTVDLSEIDFSRKHSSYSEKQLKGLLATQRYINLKKKVVFKNRVLEFFRKTSVNGVRYLILFIAKFLPDSLLDQSPLVDRQDLEDVRIAFEKDWKRVVARAERT